MTLLAYVLAEETLIGVNMPLKNTANTAESHFLKPGFLQLPVLGGWHGDRQPNLEQIMLHHPDLLLVWDTPLLNERVAADLKKLSVPYLAINIDTIDKYPAAFRRVGDALGKHERGEELARYCEKELQQLKQVLDAAPVEKRIRVYYAEDKQGLRTDCDRSFHSEPIAAAGGRNVQQCAQSSVMGMVAIDFEQLLTYNPEVIVAQEEEFVRLTIIEDKWRRLAAVRNGRVLLVPKTPFNWLDRPPSFMRILGVHWLASQFYPEVYPFNIQEKIRSFFSVFFNTDVTEGEIDTYFPDVKTSKTVSRPLEQLEK